MTPSSRDASPPSSGQSEGSFLLVLFLAADFMVFAALVGSGIVLDEGAAVWVPPAVAAALKGKLFLGGAALLGLSMGFDPGKGKIRLVFGFAVAAIVLIVEAVAVLRAGIGGSYGAFFLAVAAYVILHLVVVAGRGFRGSADAVPRSVRLFVAGTGIAALAAMHWPLYSA